MEHRQLGRDGPYLSVIGLGCNNFGARISFDESAAVVGAALDEGITHFDTAESYGNGLSEEFLGAALGPRRDEVTIATKFSGRAKDEPYQPGALATRIRSAAESSLRRLGTERIDLYYQHHPDPEAPVDEALETLDELVRAGKVLHVAVSNISAAQIQTAVAAGAVEGRARFTGVQIHWNLLTRAMEQEVVPEATASGLGIVPYYPLASGLLTGKYSQGEPFPPGSRLSINDRFAKAANDENFEKIKAYSTFATDRGHTVAELAVAWLLAQPSVTSVITGATTAEQITANTMAGTWALTQAEVAAVSEL